MAVAVGNYRAGAIGFYKVLRERARINFALLAPLRLYAGLSAYRICTWCKQRRNYFGWTFVNTQTELVEGSSEIRQERYARSLGKLAADLETKSRADRPSPMRGCKRRGREIDRAIYRIDRVRCSSRGGYGNSAGMYRTHSDVIRRCNEADRSICAIQVAINYFH